MITRYLARQREKLKKVPGRKPERKVWPYTQALHHLVVDPSGVSEISTSRLFPYPT